VVANRVTKQNPAHYLLLMDCLMWLPRYYFQRVHSKSTVEGGIMVNIDLSPDEKKVLVEVLTTCISNLRMEICDTDRKDFREEIKERKELLMKVVDALQE